jgi:hypothetical protein
VSLIAALVLLTCGCNRDDEPPGQQHAARQFNSKLRLVVWARIDDTPMPVGNTPAEAALEVPACEQWWVEPPAMTADVAAEIKSQNIPGLSLFRKATDGDLAHLKDLTGLRLLHLTETQITDAGLAHIQGLTGLQELVLQGTKVTDAGLARIQSLKALRVLDLYFTKVTDAGLAYIKGLTQLRDLELSGTQVTDAGLPALKGLSELRSLKLRQTDVTLQCMEELQESMPRCRIGR